MSVHVNLSANAAALKEAYKAVLDKDNSINWLVLGYVKGTNDLKVVGTGEEGLEELAEEFEDDKVLFAFTRVTDPNSNLPKYIFISWCGEGAPVQRKGLLPSHLNDVQKFLSGYHVQINARDSEDVTPKHILKKMDEGSGAKYSYHEQIQSRSPKPPTSAKTTAPPPLPQYKRTVQNPTPVEKKSTPPPSFKAPAASQSLQDRFLRQVENSDREKDDREKQDQFEKEFLARSGNRSRQPSEPRAVSSRVQNAKDREEQELRERMERARANRTQQPDHQQQAEEEAKKAEQRRQAEEEARQAEQRRQEEEETRRAEQRRQEEERQADQRRQEEEQQAEQRRQEEEQQAEQRRQAEEQEREAEQRRQAEEEEERQAEQRRRARLQDPESEDESEKIIRRLRAEREAENEELASGRLRIQAALLREQEMERERAEREQSGGHDQSHSEFERMESERRHQEEEASTREREEQERLEWEAAQAREEQERRDQEAAYAREEQERRDQEAAYAREEQEREELLAAQAKEAEQLRYSEPVPQESDATSSSITAIALFDYIAADETELSVREGEMVVNIVQIDEGWWQGSNEAGETGIFPANYVEVVDNPPPVTATEAPAAETTSDAHAIALYDYQATEEGELSFAAADKITQIEFLSDDWWQGANPQGEHGLFPANYVELQS